MEEDCQAVRTGGGAVTALIRNFPSSDCHRTPDADSSMMKTDDKNGVAQADPTRRPGRFANHKEEDQE